MKDQTRSLRRHHAARMKRKAFSKLYGTWYLPSCTASHEETVKEAWEGAARLRNHLAVCSCFGCGNPRRHYGNKKYALTMQELRQEDIAKSFDQ